MDFYYLEDGSVVSSYNGMPYNFHPEATPEQWIWFHEQLLGGRATEVPKPADPEPAPTDYSLIENLWRDSEMPKAQQNVTAIEYGEPGDAQAWKAYWLALRKWTSENPDFPDATKRPQAPS